MDEKSQWRYLQGVKHERERIIDMLEKKRCSCSTMVCIPFCRHGLTLDEIIALIKHD